MLVEEQIWQNKIHVHGQRRNEALLQGLKGKNLTQYVDEEKVKND